MAHARTVETVDVVCNTCGGRDATEIARAQDLEFQTCTNEFVFVQCNTCGLVYLRNRPTDAELSTIYPAGYYQYDAYLGILGRFARRLSQRQKSAFVRRFAPPGTRILDVGCGTGELLRQLREGGDRSWQLAGLDISAETVAQLRRDGIEAYAGRFEDVDLPQSSFDLILMNQTLEHLADPRGCLGVARRLLSPRGVVIAETPSLDAWDARWFPRELWAGWHCPRHWNIYTPETVTRLATDTGFQVLEIKPLPSPYFWLRSVQHVVAHRLHRRRLAGLFSERSLLLLGIAVAVDLCQAAVRGRTSNMRVVARRRADHPGSRPQAPF